MRFVANAVFLLIFAGGCSDGNPAPKKPAPVGPAAAEKDDADDPIVKEAKADTDALFKDLLAGKANEDTMLATIAAKVKPFDSVAIESQKLMPGQPKTVRFDGTLKGARGEAKFSVRMVKQGSGKWAIGTFSGPHPK